MHRSKPVLWAVALAVIVQISACGGVTELTKENVNRAETAVLQAQQAIGNSEYGALELQRARDHVTVAKTAVAEGNETQAANHAGEAQLDAELAVTKSQSAVARKAADEMRASINMLREEAARTATDLQ